MRVEILVLVVVFFAVTALAYVIGAPNTAQAATYGEIAFAATIVGFMLKRP